MYKRAIINLVILVTFSSIIIAAFAISNNENAINPYTQSLISSNSSTNVSQDIVDYKTGAHDLVGSNINHKILTPPEAQKIAEKYIKVPDATAGTPKLVKEEGKKVYIIPVMDHNQNVGEIHIDAHSGKNLGGCGGVK